MDCSKIFSRIEPQLWRRPLQLPVNQQVLLKPLDYSFLKLTAMEDLNQGETPRLETHRPIKELTTNKYYVDTVKLNNNAICDITKLPGTLGQVVFDVSMLRWLDLSFNRLAFLSASLEQLSGLRILYLHGNQLESWTQLRRLALLPVLHTLTLHGNPLDRTAMYRCRVLLQLPQLRRLDFSVVTDADRVLMLYNMLPRNRANTQQQNDDDE